MAHHMTAFYRRYAATVSNSSVGGVALYLVEQIKPGKPMDESAARTFIALAGLLNRTVESLGLKRRAARVPTLEMIAAEAETEGASSPGVGPDSTRLTRASTPLTLRYSFKSDLSRGRYGE